MRAQVEESRREQAAHDQHERTRNRRCDEPQRQDHSERDGADETALAEGNALPDAEERAIFSAMFRTVPAPP